MIIICAAAAARVYRSNAMRQRGSECRIGQWRAGCRGGGWGAAADSTRRREGGGQVSWRAHVASEKCSVVGGEFY